MKKTIPIHVVLWDKTDASEIIGQEDAVDGCVEYEVDGRYYNAQRDVGPAEEPEIYIKSIIDGDGNEIPISNDEASRIKELLMPNPPKNWRRSV